MEEQQLITEQPKKSVKLIDKKIIFIILLILFVVCYASGFLSGWSLKESQTNNNQNINPTVSVSINPSLSVSPSQSVTPSLSTTPDEFASWSNYIFSDCQVRLKAPTDWNSGKRGDEGTCGSLIHNGGIISQAFSGSPGTIVVNFPFMVTNSRFKFNNANKYDQYLQSVETDLSRKKPERDFLYSQEEITFVGLKAIKADIERPNIGRAIYIFYTVLGKEYVFAYGGQGSVFDINNINKIISTIVLLVPVSPT